MTNNKIILSGCIDNFKQDNSLTNSASEVFELFALSQITKELDLTFEEIEASIVDGGNDGGIDSLIVLVDENSVTSPEDLEDVTFSAKTHVTIIVSQCKKEDSFKESAIDKLITTVPELFSLDKSEDALLVRFNPDLVSLAMVAREAWKKCVVAGGKLRIHFNYITFGEKVNTTGTFNAKVNQLKEIATGIFVGADVLYENFSSEELLRLFQVQKNQRLSLRFKENPLSTSYGAYGIGYVGMVKLGDFFQFLSGDNGGIRDDLFESNVRHFQGLVDVNKKIKQTIDNPNSEDFWWLNNGITIIASNPSLVGTLLSLDNIQIVNGLQTSYSIYQNHSGSEDDLRSVLVKVIITEDKAVIDHIIASTNSQNAVSPVLLRATDDVQRKMEMFFQNAGYFYDRRKNYYKNQGKPATKIFSIQTAAQAIESILFNSPHSARSKPTSLVKDDTTYNRVFDPARDFRVALNCCLLFKRTGDLWSQMDDKETKAKLANFKLHIARVAASYLLGKSTYDPNEVASINLDNYDEGVFDLSIELLSETVRNYQEEAPDANLINMAKSKAFSDALLKNLKSRFP